MKGIFPTFMRHSYLVPFVAVSQHLSWCVQETVMVRIPLIICIVSY